MAKKKNQLTQVDKVTIPKNFELYRNPNPLIEEIVKIIADLPTEIRKNFSFVIAVQTEGHFLEMTKH